MDALKKLVSSIPPFYAFLINCGFAFLVILTMLIMPAFSLIGYGVSAFNALSSVGLFIYILMMMFACVPAALSFIKRTIPEILVMIFAGVYFTFMVLIKLCTFYHLGTGFWVNIILFLPAWIIFAWLRKGMPVSPKATDK